MSAPTYSTRTGVIEAVQFTGSRRQKEAILHWIEGGGRVDYYAPVDTDGERALSVFWEIGSWHFFCKVGDYVVRCGDQFRAVERHLFEALFQASAPPANDGGAAALAVLNAHLSGSGSVAQDWNIAPYKDAFAFTPAGGARSNTVYVVWGGRVGIFRPALANLEDVYQQLTGGAGDPVRPGPCDMRHEEPYDFAHCVTHDTTFALGDKCEWDGVTSITEHLEARAETLRSRMVRAEARAEAAEAEVAHLRGLMPDVPPATTPDDIERFFARVARAQERAAEVQLEPTGEGDS